MNRKLKLISDPVSELLMRQIVHELQNYLLYNSFANYFAEQGIDSLYTYYKKRAAEEKVHHDWIFDYLTKGDCRIIYPNIPTLDIQTVESIIDPFLVTVEREIETTNMIYEIYEIAEKEKDFMTMSWLYEKLIKEQIEEENVSRAAQSIMELEGAGLLEKSEKVLELLDT
jgi:ferritin